MPRWNYEVLQCPFSGTKSIYSPRIEGKSCQVLQCPCDARISSMFILIFTKHITSLLRDNPLCPHLKTKQGQRGTLPLLLLCILVSSFCAVLLLPCFPHKILSTLLENILKTFNLEEKFTFIGRKCPFAGTAVKNRDFTLTLKGE